MSMINTDKKMRSRIAILALSTMCLTLSVAAPSPPPVTLVDDVGVTKVEKFTGSLTEVFSLQLTKIDNLEVVSIAAEYESNMLVTDVTEVKTIRVSEVFIQPHLVDDHPVRCVKVSTYNRLQKEDPGSGIANVKLYLRHCSIKVYGAAVGAA
jgi:hypothetical protein